MSARRVCVFCGASPGDDPAFLEAARRTGRELARRGLGVVFGGGRVGLMGALADAALAEGGEVFGVIPASMVERELAHEGLTHLEVVPSMHVRKQRMHALSDAFLVLPGGIGTYDELFETLTWMHLGIHAKPVGVLDVSGYFAPLLAMLRHGRACGLLRVDPDALLLVEADLERLLDDLFEFRTPPPEVDLEPAEG